MKRSDNSKVERIGVCLVGEQFRRNGYIFREQPIDDYGIDAQIEVTEDDNVTGELIAIQIKSGPSWFNEETEEGYIFRGDNRHLQYWLEHSLPVIIVLCDVDKRVCYWQAITVGSIEHTKKAWKIMVPKYQRINAGMDVDLKKLVKKLPVHKSYTIGSIEDQSHGAAKRYSLNIILNKEHTQSEIIELIKKVTEEAKNTQYHRNEITGSHWRDQPAHVVWLLIYPSAEDARNKNFICQSEWFSHDIVSKFLPISNNGESIGMNIRVKWNNSYLEYSKYCAKHTITKESFVSQVSKLTNQIIPLIESAVNLLSQFEDNEIDFKQLSLILTNDYTMMDGIYSKGNNLGIAPFECKDLNVKFQSLICHAHNVYLPFSGNGSDIGQTFELNQSIFNITSQTKYFYKALAGFEFELDKVK